MLIRKLAFLSVAAIPLAACASAASDYPSLAIRDAERVSGELAAPANTAPAPPPIPASADLLQRLGELQSAARSAHAAFLKIAPSATRKVSEARNAAVASDRWATAQIALADLDSQRSQAAIALADLDALYTQSAIALERRGEIESARAAVIDLIAAEDEVLARLRGSLRQ